MRVWDDDRAAVHFECDPGDTSYANDLVKLIQRGDITDLSLFYFVLRSHKEQDSLGSYQVVESGSLIAIAISSFGAFEGAIAEVQKAAESDRKLARLEAFVKNSQHQNAPRQKRPAPKPLGTTPSARGSANSHWAIHHFFRMMANDIYPI